MDLYDIKPIRILVFIKIIRNRGKTLETEENMQTKSRFWVF